MKSARRPLDFSLTEPPAVRAAAKGAVTEPAQQAPAAKGEGLKQLNTRIPASTHQAFKITAIQEGVSVQELLARLIDRHLAESAARKN
jgi:predicted HicB family RNase H-like nuclease